MPQTSWPPFLVLHVPLSDRFRSVGATHDRLPGDTHRGGYTPQAPRATFSGSAGGEMKPLLRTDPENSPHTHARSTVRNLSLMPYRDPLPNYQVLGGGAVQGRGRAKLSPRCRTWEYPFWEGEGTLPSSRTVALAATMRRRRRRQLEGILTPRQPSQVPRNERGQVISHLSCPLSGEPQGMPRKWGAGSTL